MTVTIASEKFLIYKVNKIDKENFKEFYAYVYNFIKCNHIVILYVRKKGKYKYKTNRMIFL